VIPPGKGEYQPDVLKLEIRFKNGHFTFQISNCVSNLKRETCNAHFQTNLGWEVGFH